ncbi:MAG: hypothetical protein ACPL0F_06580 [bacterium]
MTQVPSPHEPQPLKFEPDMKRLERLARFRQVVIWSTLGMMVVALVWVLLLPSRVPRVSEPVAPVAGGVEPRVAVVPAPESAPAPVGPAGVQSDPLVTARALVLTIDSSLNAARGQWELAGGMVSAITIRLENVPEILRRIGLARGLQDSAAIRLAGAQAGLSRLQGLLSSPGLAGVRIGAAYAAARDYVRLVEEEGADQQGWLESYEQAIRALADGDSAQFDIKLNVAGAYQRKVEVRQRRLIRAGAALRSVVGGW